MTNYALTHKRCHPWSDIDKGPGTAALEKAKLGDRFDFSGVTIQPGHNVFVGKQMKLLAKSYCGADTGPGNVTYTWELWFEDRGYPNIVCIRYNSHSREGVASLWERIPTPAEKKAEKADKGSMMELPVSFLLTMGITYTLLGLCAYLYHDSIGGFFTFVFASLGVVGPEFILFAIYKSDRDNFWRALDTIDKLDLTEVVRQRIAQTV